MSQDAFGIASSDPDCYRRPLGHRAERRTRVPDDACHLAAMARLRPTRSLARTRGSTRVRSVSDRQHSRRTELGRNDVTGTLLDGPDGFISRMTSAALRRALQADPANLSRTINGLDYAVLALYSRCINARQFREFLARGGPGPAAPSDLEQAVAAAVVDEITLWQCWPLHRVYPILCVEGIRVHRPGQLTIDTTPAYLAVGVDAHGNSDVLSCWAAESADERFWRRLLVDLRRRRVMEIRGVLADDMPGLAAAVSTTFPHAVMPAISSARRPVATPLAPA